MFMLPFMVNKDVYINVRGGIQTRGTFTKPSLAAVKLGARPRAGVYRTRTPGVNPGVHCQARSRRPMQAPAWFDDVDYSDAVA